VRYIKRKDAEKAIAKYLRKQDVKRYGRPRLANSEYMFVAIDILRDVSDEGKATD
jgi:hypothetical protein